MEIFGDVNFKALVFGAAIAGTCVISGYTYWDGFYPFASIGLLYAGYAQKNIKYATVIGAIASSLLVILALDGYFGELEGFFATETGVIVISIIILLVGALVGFVGGWAKRSRIKAKEEYEKQQKIGKKKNNKKKAKAQKTKEKTTYVDKIFKK